MAKKRRIQRKPNNQAHCVCQCLRKINPKRHFHENTCDMSTALTKVMIICGLTTPQAEAARGSILNALTHYDEIRCRIEEVPTKILRKAQLIYNLGCKSSMTRKEAQLTYSIVKRAFKAFYYGTDKFTVKDPNLEAQMVHSQECLWVHAAKRTAQIYAEYEGMFFKAQKQIEEQIKCVYKNLYERMQNRASPTVLTSCCCQSCIQKTEAADQKEATITTSSSKDQLSNHLPNSLSSIHLGRGKTKQKRAIKSKNIQKDQHFEMMPPYKKCKCPKLTYDRTVIGKTGTLSHDCSQGPFIVRWIPMIDGDMSEPYEEKPEKREQPIDCDDLSEMQIEEESSDVYEDEGEVCEEEASTEISLLPTIYKCYMPEVDYTPIMLDCRGLCDRESITVIKDVPCRPRSKKSTTSSRLISGESGQTGKSTDKSSEYAEQGTDISGDNLHLIPYEVPGKGLLRRMETGEPPQFFKTIENEPLKLETPKMEKPPETISVVKTPKLEKTVEGDPRKIEQKKFEKTGEGDERKIEPQKFEKTGKGEPKTESPKTESPKTESPKTESPKTESPKTESPKLKSIDEEVDRKTDSPKFEEADEEVERTSESPQLENIEEEVELTTETPEIEIIDEEVELTTETTEIEIIDEEVELTAETPEIESIDEDIESDSEPSQDEKPRRSSEPEDGRTSHRKSEPPKPEKTGKRLERKIKRPKVERTGEGDESPKLKKSDEEIGRKTRHPKPEKPKKSTKPEKERTLKRESEPPKLEITGEGDERQLEPPKTEYIEKDEQPPRHEPIDEEETGKEPPKGKIPPKQMKSQQPPKRTEKEEMDVPLVQPLDTGKITGSEPGYAYNLKRKNKVLIDKKKKSSDTQKRKSPAGSVSENTRRSSVDTPIISQKKKVSVPDKTTVKRKPCKICPKKLKRVARKVCKETNDTGRVSWSTSQYYDDCCT